MKRYFYLIAAIAGLLMAASCQKENFEVAEGDYADVSFTTELPSGVATKAIADGQTVNKLYYEVYAAEDAEGTVAPVTKGDVTVTAGTASVNVRLIKNKPYTIFFWAQYEGENYTSPYTWTDLRNISVSYTNAVANDERRDAFYFVAKGVKYSGATTTPVTLTRPFAQVNVGTNDRAEFERDGVTLNGATSTITVTNVADTFEPFTNRATATGTTELTASFSTAAAIPAEELSVVVNNSNNTYDYLAMAYVLVPNATGEASSTSVSTISSDITLSGISDPISISYEGATVQQNRRTNLVGKLLTTTSSYDIVIDNNFVKPDNTYEYENVATTAEANAAFAEGKTSIKIEAIEETAATLTLPETTETTSVVLPETDAVVTFEYPAEATETPEVLNITAPEGADIVLDVPNTTVYVNGVLQTVTASTAQNTLIVEEGSVITELIIVKGNVRIEKGGKVEKITRSEDNTDTETKVYLGEGVVPPTVDPADPKIVFVPFTTPDATKTFVEQVAATTYGKVTLTENVVLDAPLTIEKNQEVIIDLNGYTISQSNEQTAAYSMIQNQGKLVLKDSKDTGKIVYGDTGNGGEYVSNTILNSGTMTIESGIFENHSGESVATNGYPHVIDNSGKLIINGGTFTNMADYSTIRIWCTEDDDTDVTINDGTFNGSIDLHNVNAKANKGTLTINGGTFNADTYTKCAVRLLGFGTDVDEINCYIYGGHFNGAIKLNNYVGGTFNSDVFHIIGGTFSSLTPLVYMGEGEQATFKIKDDMVLTEEESITIPAGANVTLDLNGYDINSAVNNNGKPSAIFSNYGILNLVNNSGNKSNVEFVAANPDMEKIPSYATNTITNYGTLTIDENVTVTNSSDGGASYAVDNLGYFTLNGGTLIGNRCALRIINSNAAAVEFTMNSGSIQASTPAWVQLPGNVSTVAPKITVNINGGKIESTKPSSEDNDVMYTYSFGNSHANTTINISGGEFLGGTVSIGSGYKGDIPTLNITGGVFEYDVVQWLPEDKFNVLYNKNK